MIQSLFFLSRTGEPIVDKHWRGITTRTICDFFWSEVSKYDSREEVPPVISTSKYYLISALRDDIFLLAVATTETSPLMTLEFLHRVFDIFIEYFENLEESTIKENFTTVYQLLEEMMDYGYPLTTEPNALKAMIQPPSVMGRITSAATGKSGISDSLPDGTISNMPWRQTGVTYSQNEIYLDIIEEIDAVVDVKGNMVSIDVSGSIQANSRLSGVPDLMLQFTDPAVIDDCSFHPCVRYNRYDRDKVVSFVPPDGQFELMRYRVNCPNSSPVVPPIFCQPQFTFDRSGNFGGGGAERVQVSIAIGLQMSTSIHFPSSSGNIVIEDVMVVVPFPKSVRTANLSVTSGHCLFDESTKVAKWTVGKLQRDQAPMMKGMVLMHKLNQQQGQGSNSSGSSGLGSGNRQDELPPIQMHWKVPMASVSGLAVAGLQLTNERYKPYKGVRTLTKSGKFQIRSS